MIVFIESRINSNICWTQNRKNMFSCVIFLILCLQQLAEEEERNIFGVSTLAFNPNSPGANATVRNEKHIFHVNFLLVFSFIFTFVILISRGLLVTNKLQSIFRKVIFGQKILGYAYFQAHH